MVQHALEYAKFRYGKDILDRRVKVMSASKGWRTGKITAYHGGYLRHSILFDDGEKVSTQLYQEQYEFLPQDDAEPIGDLIHHNISVQSGLDNKWTTGEVVDYDGIMHTVLLGDDEILHVNLQQQPYKVVEKVAGTAAPARKSATPTPPPVPAPAAKAPKQEPGTGRTAARSADTSAHAPSGQEPVTETDSQDGGGPPNGDGPARRSTRAAAAAAVAASKPSHTSREVTPAGEVPAPRQAPLNLSNVGKKDREAVRALLGFSQHPHVGECPAKASSEDPDGSSKPRKAIAVVAAAAAAAAGLPDHSTGGTSLGEPAENGPSGTAKAKHKSPSPPATAAAARAAAHVPATATDAPAAGTVDPGVGRMLMGLQQQMQQLVKQEQKRSLELISLRAKAANAQEERDAAVKAKDAAVRERDASRTKLHQLQDDNRALKTQVELLERQLMQMQAQLSVEHGMVGGLSMDTAALQAQISGLRSEMASVKAESTHLLLHIKNVAAVAAKQPSTRPTKQGTEDSPKSSDAPAAVLTAGTRVSAPEAGKAINSNPQNTHTAAPAPADVPSKGIVSGGGGGGGAKPRQAAPDSQAAFMASTVAPRIDPAAAAALPVNVEVLQKPKVPVKQQQQAQQQQQQQPQRMVSLKPSPDNRSAGVGQLMVVGPGRMVFGPNSRSGCSLQPAAVRPSGHPVQPPAQVMRPAHPTKSEQHTQQEGSNQQQQQQGADKCPLQPSTSGPVEAAPTSAADAPKKPQGAAERGLDKPTQIQHTPEPQPQASSAPCKLEAAGDDLQDVLPPGAEDRLPEQPAAQHLAGAAHLDSSLKDGSASPSSNLSSPAETGSRKRKASDPDGLPQLKVPKLSDLQVQQVDTRDSKASDEAGAAVDAAPAEPPRAGMAEAAGAAQHTQPWQGLETQHKTVRAMHL